MKHRNLDILIVTDMPFWRRGQGSFNRVSELHQALKKNKFTVGVYVPSHLRPDPSGKARWRADPQAPTHVIDRSGPISNFAPSRGVRLLGDRVKAKISGQKIADIDTLPTKRSMLHIAQVYKPQAVFFEFATMAPLAESLKVSPETCDIVRIVDTHDVRWKRAEDFRAAGIDLSGAWTKEQETQRLENFDILVGITDDDTAELSKMCPAAKTITAAHPVDLPSSELKAQIDDQSKPIIRFIASNTPTRKSLPVFLEKVWPLVLQRLEKHVMLQIVGNVNSNLHHSYDDSVEFLPRTKTIEDLFLPAHIIVNPMICGSGLKIKNLEALSYGKPLITSSAGAQGMPDKTTTDAFVVADKAEDIADAIVELASNPVKRQAMSAEAKKYISRHFTRDVVYRELFDFLSELVRK